MQGRMHQCGLDRNHVHLLPLHGAGAAALSNGRRSALVRKCSGRGTAGWCVQPKSAHMGGESGVSCRLPMSCPASGFSIYNQTPMQTKVSKRRVQACHAKVVSKRRVQACHAKVVSKRRVQACHASHAQAASPGGRGIAGRHDSPFQEEASWAGGSHGSVDGVQHRHQRDGCVFVVE